MTLSRNEYGQRRDASTGTKGSSAFVSLRDEEDSIKKSREIGWCLEG